MPGDQSERDSLRAIRTAQVVVPCAELPPMMDFFIQRLGFRLERISPADDPRSALISGHGLEILLRRGGAVGDPGRLRLLCERPLGDLQFPSEIVAPNGLRVEFCDEAPPLAIPAVVQELVIDRGGDENWITGRAGMGYRDLIPGRLGGCFIASKIRIETGGPVPDYVHFHAIRFQMIYCAAGWVRLVYEDQGPPFIMAAGDCVLQPPHIRHQVLESSEGLEVVELACPGEHDTFLDHALDLPTPDLRPERDFGGQRFVHHQLSRASWKSDGPQGFEFRDTGIGAATDGLASTRVVRATGIRPPAQAWRHAGELLFIHLLTGSVTIDGLADESLSLDAGDSLTVPAGTDATLTGCTADLEFLEVRLPE